jgi:hypothetical protein
MDARTYWYEYLARNGGVKGVADRLATPYQTIASITNGHRGIGPRLVERFVARDPMLDPNKLIWIRANREAM